MRIYAALAAVVLLAGISHASAATSDAEFARQVAKENASGTQLSRVAQERAQNAELKKYAQIETSDHTRLGDVLARLAQSKNIQLDIPAQEQALLESFANLQGIQFDRAFLDWTINSHNQAVTLFSDEANGGQDPELKMFATNILPLLQNHLKMARDLNDRMARAAVAADRSNPAVSGNEQPMNTTYEPAMNTSSERRSTLQSSESAPYRSEFREESPIQTTREHRERYTQYDNNVSYESSATSSDCGCEHVETCNTCGGFPTPIYDNDYSATETSFIEHPE